MKVLAILLLLSGQARAEYVDCVAVRAKVKEHGKVKAITWALANGYTITEISRIRKQCGI